MITITIKLFAIYQEVYGSPELILQFPVNTTVGEVLERLMVERPELRSWKELTRFGVNLEFVSSDTILRDGDELVLIPPVSGG